MSITKEQLPTVLAALRYWQNDLDDQTLSDKDGPFGEFFVKHPALNAAQLNALCEHLNLGEPGFTNPGTVAHVLSPAGELGKQFLTVRHDRNSIEIIGEGDYARHASVYLDWHNDRLQFLVYDGVEDENAVMVRLHRDGSVAEIIVRDDLMGEVKIESGETSPWQEERDNH